MSLLTLKLVLIPALVGLTSLAGRRWGPAVSGWIVGLPLTSGPVAFFVALHQGAPFAAATATGTLAGGLSLCLYCLVYAWLARWWPWPVALAGSGGAFFLSTLVLQWWALPLPAAAGFVGAALLLTLRALPPETPLDPAAPPLPRWDLPVRMGLATVFVLGLTDVAPLFGPRLTGLLATFPMYTTLLTVFAHFQQGSGAAARLLRGLVLGLFSFSAFYIVLGSTLMRWGIPAAFSAAIGAAVLVQLGSLRRL